MQDRQWSGLHGNAAECVSVSAGAKLKQALLAVPKGGGECLPAEPKDYDAPQQRNIGRQGEDLWKFWSWS